MENDLTTPTQTEKSWANAPSSGPKPLSSLLHQLSSKCDWVSMMSCFPVCNTASVVAQLPFGAILAQVCQCFPSLTPLATTWPNYLSDLFDLASLPHSKWNSSQDLQILESMPALVRWCDWNPEVPKTKGFQELKMVGMMYLPWNKCFQPRRYDNPACAAYSSWPAD